jgi:hypothetical protein
MVPPLMTSLTMWTGHQTRKACAQWYVCWKARLRGGRILRGDKGRALRQCISYILLFDMDILLFDMDILLFDMHILLFDMHILLFDMHIFLSALF